MRLVVCLKKWIHNWLRTKGYVLLKYNELEFIRNFYKEVLLLNKSKTVENKIDSIVFSKDRAMQLHAFIGSYFEKAEGHGRLIVLYKATSIRHKNSYNELKKIFRASEVLFIEEDNFRDQLINICENSKARILGLFVDDMIFINDIDYRQILKFDPLHNIVSLGRGPELNYSVVLERAQSLPIFTPVEEGFLRFKWDYSDEKNDWTYPLGVGGYFYDANELMVMVRNINFSAPNSLEAGLQIFKSFFIDRNGVCKEKMTCITVPANLVQTEGKNPVIGTFGVEELLDLWDAGNMIDLSGFYGVDGNQAQRQKYTFVKRSLK